MYIGGTGSAGLTHLLWEIIDNAIDEAVGGHCNRIEVVFHRDRRSRCYDNGRGIPIDRHPKRKVSALEVVLTELHAGGKFGGGAYGASGGLHGVGASVVNALSTQLVAEVDRDGHTWQLSFLDRVAGHFDSKDRFKASHELMQLKTGTFEEDRHPHPFLARLGHLRCRRGDRHRTGAPAHHHNVLPRTRIQSHPHR